MEVLAPREVQSTEVPVAAMDSFTNLQRLLYSRSLSPLDPADNSFLHLCDSCFASVWVGPQFRCSIWKWFQCRDILHAGRGRRPQKILLCSTVFALTVSIRVRVECLWQINPCRVEQNCEVTVPLLVFLPGGDVRQGRTCLIDEVWADSALYILLISTSGRL